MIEVMFKLFLVLWSLCLLPNTVLASDKVFVTPPQVDAYTYIDEPQLLMAYYGELDDFPHTYVITLSEATFITGQLLEPNSDNARQNISGLLVREAERGVEEVARFPANSSDWEKQFVFTTGDSYLLGPAYTGTLEPGVYYLEVSNADNLGKYVFQIGTEANPERIGYFGKLKEVYTIKKFLGKPVVMVLQSPYYFVPTLILLASLFWWYLRRSQRYA